MKSILSISALVMAAMGSAGCSSNCGQPVYRGSCDPAPRLFAAEPDRCGQPVYTAPKCLPDLKPLFGGINSQIFGCFK